MRTCELRVRCSGSTHSTSNEGKLVAVIPAKWADAVLARIKAHPLGVRAAVIGHVTEQHLGLVAARTALGGTRVVSRPRIC